MCALFPMEGYKAGSILYFSYFSKPQEKTKANSVIVCLSIPSDFPTLSVALTEDVNKSISFRMIHMSTF